MDTRIENIWNRWKQGYSISMKEYAILGAYMDEYYYRLSIPPKLKVPGWTSEDYDKSNKLVGGWDYSTLSDSSH